MSTVLPHMVYELSRSCRTAQRLQRPAASIRRVRSDFLRNLPADLPPWPAGSTLLVIHIGGCVLRVLGALGPSRRLPDCTPMLGLVELRAHAIAMLGIGHFIA